MTTPTCRAPTLSPHVHPWTGRAGLRQVAALIYTLLVSAAGALGTCTVGGGTLAFGTYSARTGASASTTVNVTCTLATAYTLSLDNGLNFSGTRRLKASVNGSSYYLPYTASITLPTGVGTGLPVGSVITGSAPAGANVPAGTYTDTLTVTVTF